MRLVINVYSPAILTSDSDLLFVYMNEEQMRNAVFFLKPGSHGVFPCLSA